MKRIYTLTLAILFLSSSFSQGIEIYKEGSTTDISGTTVYGSGDDFEMKYYLTIKNVSTSDLNLTIKRLRVDELAGTKDYFCWGISLLNGQCYSETAVSAYNPWVAVDYYDYPAGEEGILYSYHKPYGNNGMVKYRYYVMENGGAILDSVDVQYNNFLSTKTTKTPTIDIFPNPAQNILNIQAENISNLGSILIYDISGKEVLSSEFKNGNNKLNVEALTSGIYFYTIRNGKNTIETKKLLIQ
ncbi:MAG: T9SS type A sorting domain-containing protein [Crocinitomicaceae bacterium]